MRLEVFPPLREYWILLTMARPGRNVIRFAGDGVYLMLNSELATWNSGKKGEK